MSLVCRYDKIVGSIPAWGKTFCGFCVDCRTAIRGGCASQITLLLLFLLFITIATTIYHYHYHTFDYHSNTTKLLLYHADEEKKKNQAQPNKHLKTQRCSASLSRIQNRSLHPFTTATIIATTWTWHRRMVYNNHNNNSPWGNGMH